MTKKENQARAANNSLLQTARIKKFGVGRFSLLSLKSKPQPPVKKVKVPVFTTNNNGKLNGKPIDEGSKISDITSASGAEVKPIISWPAVVKKPQTNVKLNDNGCEVESSVLGMSMNSGDSYQFSLTKAYIQEVPTTKNADGVHVAGNKQKAIQPTAFASLWPASNGNANQLKGKKFVKTTKSLNKDHAFAKKKTMDISTGLRFTAPAPMTLNRYQPQMGQEKAAPESKEYLEMEAERKMQEQRDIEAKHIAEAKLAIEERLKQAFESKEIGADLNDQLNALNIENNLLGNTGVKKKSVIKKILGKVRPNSSKKWRQNQEKSSAIKAAMAAAAAAVEAATENPKGNEYLSEQEARTIVNQALSASKQKQTIESTPELSAAVFHPSMINTESRKMPTKEIVVGVDKFGRPVHFPINEVTMKLNEDSVSDLDASIRNMRKVPMVEIHMNDAKQCHGDGSVSTLGTPRVFEQMDKLLLAEPHRLNHQPGVIRNVFEDNANTGEGSAAPPPMVTSLDARALIDQFDSGTMAGDMTAGTARAENAVQLCNITGACFHHEQKSLLTEGSDHDETFDDSETSVEEKMSEEERSVSPTPGRLAIDDAKRKPGVNISTNRTGTDEEIPLSPIGESKEVMTSITSPNGSEVAVRESKSPPSSPHAMNSLSQMAIHPLPDQETTRFDRFMDIAALKLDKIAEADNGTYQRKDQYKFDRYSTENDLSPRAINIQIQRKDLGVSNNEKTPKTRGGVKHYFFESKSSGRHFSDHHFDLLPTEKSKKNSQLPKRISKANRMTTTEAAGTGSEFVHDLIQVDEHLQMDEHDENKKSRRKKTYGKSQTGSGSRHEGTTVDQGRFLLEKDDAYWDTLSTIASTANDRSSESDEYMDEIVEPGPIPGEITTSSSEIKSEEKRKIEQSLSRPEGSLNDMLNDVTGLIDANLLDRLPGSTNTRSANPVILESDSELILEKRTTASHKRKKITNQMKPNPEAIQSSIDNDQSRSGNLAMAASNISKGIRSVRWGFEEIYEDKNSHLDLSDEDTSKSEEGTYGMTQKAHPSPEGVSKTRQRPLHSNGSGLQTTDEEDLLSRTLELSKGLLETIMGSSKVIQEQKTNLVSSNSPRELSYKENHRNEQTIRTEHRDDYNHEETIDLTETSEEDLSPMIQSRLESLRMQRSRALEEFRQSQMPGNQETGLRSSNKTEPIKRDRDRLKYYTYSHDYVNQSRNARNFQRSNYKKLNKEQPPFSEDSDIELKYTTSESNASTTPSQKARDLRIQLNEAMRASREIQISQTQLGSELNSFKNKYYRNREIEDYALKVIRGGV